MTRTNSFFERLEVRQLLASTASIVGYVFNDINMNGHRDTGESNIPKVTIYLDKNNNKKLDTGENSTVTDSSGNYSFTKLAAGAYLVRQIVPANMTQTTPTKGYGIHLSLKTGQKTTNRYFGDVSVTPPVPAQPFWSTFGGDAEHTADSSVATQDLKKLIWHTTVDLAPQFQGGELFIHYGSPVITRNNTVIVPVKTTLTGGFELRAYRGSDGTLLWKQSTDYILPPSGWTPEFQPAIAPNGRIYFAGAGGTIYWRDNIDSASGNTGQIAFYGLSKYTANKTSLNSRVFVDTPLTIDGKGNVFFGVQVTGTSNPLNLKGGIARIDANGNGTFVTATVAANDTTVDKDQQNSAPAISNDGKLVYVVVNRTNPGAIISHTYLLALDSTTLATVDKVELRNPVDGSSADLTDISTASPTVGPDGDVYFGILDAGNENHDRGYLLHFSGDLKTQKISGSFGWDDTASIVPASMVPSYHGNSSYLLMTKYNDYADRGGSGLNKLAILDPNATQVDPTTGITVMKEVLTIKGATPDPDFPSNPGAVKEWCINSAAVDPAADSVLVNSEDGTLYRWDLKTNTLTQKIALTGGIGEAYTPTAVGPDGLVYAINRGILWAVGNG